MLIMRVDKEGSKSYIEVVGSKYVCIDAIDNLKADVIISNCNELYSELVDSLTDEGVIMTSGDFIEMVYTENKVMELFDSVGYDWITASSSEEFISKLIESKIDSLIFNVLKEYRGLYEMSIEGDINGLGDIDLGENYFTNEELGGILPDSNKPLKKSGKTLQDFIDGIRKDNKELEVKEAGNVFKTESTVFVKMNSDGSRSTYSISTGEGLNAINDPGDEKIRFILCDEDYKDTGSLNIPVTAIYNEFIVSELYDRYKLRGGELSESELLSAFSKASGDSFRVLLNVEDLIREFMQLLLELKLM